jgi:hypothetical protein
MGIARVRISLALFLDSLSLPADTQVLQVRVSRGGDLVCDMQHPQITGVPQADGTPPATTPRFRRQASVAFLGWGQD